MEMETAATGGPQMAKPMCKLAKKDKLAEIARLSDKPQYICTKCARVANDKKSLCKPKRLDEV